MVRGLCALRLWASITAGEERMAAGGARRAEEKAARKALSRGARGGEGGLCFWLMA
jgi:hypothetical protein